MRRKNPLKNALVSRAVVNLGSTPYGDHQKATPAGVGREASKYVCKTPRSAAPLRLSLQPVFFRQYRMPGKAESGTAKMRQGDAGSQARRSGLNSGCPTASGSSGCNNLQGKPQLLRSLAVVGCRIISSVIGFYVRLFFR